MPSQLVRLCQGDTHTKSASTYAYTQSQTDKKYNPDFNNNHNCANILSHTCIHTCTDTCICIHTYTHTHTPFAQISKWHQVPHIWKTVSLIVWRRFWMSLLHCSMVKSVAPGWYSISPLSWHVWRYRSVPALTAMWGRSSWEILWRKKDVSRSVGYKNLASGYKRNRAQELCESRDGRPGFPIPNSSCNFCGRKATWNLNISTWCHWT